MLCCELFCPRTSGVVGQAHSMRSRHCAQDKFQAKIGDDLVKALGMEWPYVAPANGCRIWQATLAQFGEELKERIVSSLPVRSVKEGPEGLGSDPCVRSLEG